MPANRKIGSTHLSAERVAHREWIGGRALTLLSHYWRDDDPVELTAAIGADWADVLEGIPAEYIQRACIQYQRENDRRKPTPGSIYQIARNFMPRPAPVPEPEREVDRVSPDRAKEILKEAGFRVNRFGGICE